MNGVVAVGARVRVDGRSLWRGSLGSAWLKWLVALSLVLVVVLDAGSVVLTKMSLADDAGKAGRAAARAVSGLPVTTTTAQVGFAAAGQVAAFNEGEEVQRSDFEVLPGGGVSLTLVRTAPSLVLGRVPWLAKYGVVSASVVVEKPVM